jgi:hypothetical protein
MSKKELSQKSINSLVEEALAIEAEQAQDAGKLGFMCRAMVQASLPSRKVDGVEFTRRNGNFTLTLLAPSRVGLPYGTVPRLLLTWLATEAVKTRERELVLGDSLSGFMRELGMTPTGGRWGTIPRLKDQTRRPKRDHPTLTHHSPRIGPGRGSPGSGRVNRKEDPCPSS